MLRSRAWTTYELSQVLGYDPDEVSELMLGLGFAQDPVDGKWCLGGDPIAELIAGNLELLSYDWLMFGETQAAASERLDRLLHERLTEFLGTGSVRPVLSPAELYESRNETFDGDGDR
jgi:hypothetical protein